MPQAPERLAVLLVEDDEDDFVITRDLLAEPEPHPLRPRVGRELRGRAARDRGAPPRRLPDRLPPRRAAPAWTSSGEAFAGERQAPVIVLTGHGDYEVDLEATLPRRHRLPGQGPARHGRCWSARSATPSVTTRPLAELRKSQERYALAVRGRQRRHLGLGPALGARLPLAALEGHARVRRRGRRGLGPRSGSAACTPTTSSGCGRRSTRTSPATQPAPGERAPRCAHRDGSYRWVLIRGAAIRDERRAGDARGRLDDRHHRPQGGGGALLHDVAPRRPDRAAQPRALPRPAERSLARAEREPDHRCAVLFLDLDRFKLVNDGFSHAAGDQLLVALAERLTGNLRPGRHGRPARRATSSRSSSTASAPSDEPRRGRRADPGDAQPSRSTSAATSCVVSASIGIAVSQRGSEPGGARCATPTSRCTTPSARARHARRSSTRRCTTRCVSQLHLEAELRRAIEERHLRVFYQPIVDLGHRAAERVRGAGPLARRPETAGARRTSSSRWRRRPA